MEFDYIIVGAGSAGCALAGRLTEEASVSVALIEAGKAEKLKISKIPAALLYTIGNKRYDWMYTPEPDPTRNNVVEPWPRGKVPGGSSAINGMIYIRGRKHDFNRWAAMGNQGWGWSDVGPIFRRMETSDTAPSQDRGATGPISVTQLGFRHPASDVMFKAVENLGIAAVEDLNGADEEGLAWNQGNISGGKRHSAWSAYIEPNLGRSNLHIRTETLVHKVVFEGSRAVGIEVETDGQISVMRARKGVVLSGGPMNTPQLLNLSGIGDPAQLQKHGIAVRVARPEVGRNLMEHPGFYIQAELDIPTSNAYRNNLFKGALATAQWFLTGKGPLGTPSAQFNAFFRSSPEVAEPDMQFLMFAYGSKMVNGKRVLPKRNLVTLLINANYPDSRGHVELASANPRDPIRIFPRMLETEHDVALMQKGLDWARALVKTEPLKSRFRGFVDVPAEGAGLDEQYIRQATRVFYHPIGTCRMGADDAAVVDPQLKVRGVDGLWIADSSIFPDHIGGNTNATSIMIGEKAADLLRAL